MKIKKQIQLTTAPLEELLEKGESIDFRLDEEVWQTLQVGDFVEFWEDFTGWQKKPTAASRRVIIRIEHIYKASGFRELFDSIEQDVARLGDKDDLLSGLRSWWSEEKETDKGVLAFHVTVVSNAD
jgi:ASC-1-like (ASCH) protein